MTSIITLSGFGSDMIDVRDAMQLAVDEVNESGGINGRELAIIVRDSESNPAVGAKKLRTLEEEVKPLLIVTTISSVSLEAAAVAEKKQLYNETGNLPRIYRSDPAAQRVLV